MATATNRKALTAEELEELPAYSELHEGLIDILVTHGAFMGEIAVFALEDALLAALKPKTSRSDFMQFSILSAGAPRLIRAIEREWPTSRVFVDQFQDPEGMGVEFSMIIEDSTPDWPSIAETVLDSAGKIADPLAATS